MELTNHLIDVDVQPANGMTIRSIRLHGGPNVLWEKSSTRELGATRDIGPVGMESIDTFHDAFIGGWFEMSPHAGLPGTVDGQETMLHGEAPRLPWRVKIASPMLVTAGAECVNWTLVLCRRVALVDSSIIVESFITNVGTAAHSITHGEHPCFSRRVFAGGRIGVDVRTAQVLDPLDPTHASLMPGPFTWPIACAIDGSAVDVSLIPSEADGAHDHVLLELDEPELSVNARDGLKVTLSCVLQEHPFVLLWRNHKALSPPSLGQWDVFALEPQGVPGRSVDDAVRAEVLTTLPPGNTVTYSVRMTVSR